MNVQHHNVINFSSENFTGVHNKILKALIHANVSTVPSYGNDNYTNQAISIFKENFGEDIEVFFTFNGTGANNFSLGSVVNKYDAVFCSDIAHLYVNESTAPEAFIGCRIWPVKSVNGKIQIDELKCSIKKANSIHFPQPKVISITQPTECGTVYNLEELHTLKEICREYKMLFHVDGARFFNAAVYLNATLKQISRDAGVDILTLGGTKNGMMFGEAVVFFNFHNTTFFRHQLKRSMQMASKNRFIAVQFQALFRDELWKAIAVHTNLLAKTAESKIINIPAVKIIYPVESNALFVELPDHLRLALQKKMNFYCWEEERKIYRFIFSFDNLMNEIDLFFEQLQNATEDATLI